MRFRFDIASIVVRRRRPDGPQRSLGPLLAARVAVVLRILVAW